MLNSADSGLVRAHQRDVFHASSLKEQTEAILRSWLGQTNMHSETRFLMSLQALAGSLAGTRSWISS